MLATATTSSVSLPLVWQLSLESESFALSVRSSKCEGGPLHRGKVRIIEFVEIKLELDDQKHISTFDLSLFLDKVNMIGKREMNSKSLLGLLVIIMKKNIVARK